MSKIIVKKSKPKKSKKGKMFTVGEHERRSGNAKGGTGNSTAQKPSHGSLVEIVDSDDGQKVVESTQTKTSWRKTKGWVVAKLAGNVSLAAAGVSWTAYTAMTPQPLSLAGVALIVLSIPFAKTNIDMLKNKQYDENEFFGSKE